MNRIIYYYQEFIDLEKWIYDLKATHIIISSLHFGINEDKSPYIHLNDNIPYSSKYDRLWEQTEQMSKNGITIMVMLGGAGGAYQQMFENYDIYYKMLLDLIKNKSWISGIDLDIEETVSIKNTQKLIGDLNRDLPEDFIITMAPLANSLTDNGGSMAGFSYKELYNSEAGKRINWFNGQFYGNFSLETCDQIVKNGYPMNKVVCGMLYSSDNPLEAYLEEIIKIHNKYPDFGGVDVWELYLTIKGKNIGYWADKIYNALYNNENERLNQYSQTSQLMSMIKCSIS
tara:strand:+ start:401 stop:1258 length:858 start_codon:yes stop_codon:yes gene_type:complete